MIKDADLPELPEPTSLRWRNGDFDAASEVGYAPAQVRTIQREAYIAGMLKAADISAAMNSHGEFIAEAIIAATKGES